MLASLLIVFREVLEAALIVTVVMAATRGVKMRGQYISGGIAAGVAGACLVAVFTSALSNSLGGVGAEIFNAAILLLAVAMLSWHVIWMGSHGKEMAQDVKKLGREITLGVRPMSALAIVVATAVLREGSEIVLFMQGLLAGSDSHTSLFIGGVLGLVAAVAVGTLMYLGMVKIPVKLLFNGTNGILVLIAAGMAGKAANYLVAAGLLPELGNRVWDTSRIISNESMIGTSLSALIGYSATPTGMQLIFFASTVAILIFCARSYAASIARPATH